MSKTWYVYLLCDPDTEMPFYVGKGTGNRINYHDRSYDNLNTEKIHIIRKIQARGKEVLKKKIAEFTDEKDAYIYEWAMINLYHEHLTNRCHSAGNPRSSEKHPTLDLKEQAYYLLTDVAQHLGCSIKTLYYAMRALGIHKHKFPLDKCVYLAADDFTRIKDAKQAAAERKH